MADLITILRSQYDADIAEAREAGAAEVRARVQAVMEGWQDDKLHGVRYAHRCIWNALNGGE